VIFVKIERPRGAYYGGVVAAPIFSQLAHTVMLDADVMRRYRRAWFGTPPGEDVKMKRELRPLLDALVAPRIVGTLPETITAIAVDSRTALPGSLFVAVRGERVDGHRFAKSAVARGAAASWSSTKSTSMFRTDRRGYACRDLAARGYVYGHPSRDLMVFGVTGTNGKTTTTYLLRSIADAAGLPCGVIGTLGGIFGDRTWPSRTRRRSHSNCTVCSRRCARPARAR